jgi:hypothetical protein
VQYLQDFEPGSYILPDEISSHPVCLFNSVHPSAPASYKIFHCLGLHSRKYFVGGSELNDSSSDYSTFAVQPDWEFNLLLLFKNIWIILFIRQWIG